jgi:hypothetical protein
MKKIVAFVIVLFLLPLSTSAQDVCEGNFDYDYDVDGSDAFTFKTDFGRSSISNPCPSSPCPVTCEGTLSAAGRWCDQNDGTVKDMSTGLVWLKDVGWGGQKIWADCSMWDDAHTRVGILYAGMPGTELSDGSIVGDWRLPTQMELVHITRVGDEYIRYNELYFFTGGQNSPTQAFWTSTTLEGNHDYAICVHGDSTYGGCDKQFPFYVWPVRGSN